MGHWVHITNLASRTSLAKASNKGHSPLATGRNDERLNRNNLNIVENIIKNCRLAVRHMIYLSNWVMKSVVQGNVHESHLAKTQYADALRGWISMISRHRHTL